MAKRFQAPPPLEERQFGSAEEIDLAVKKLERRIQELRNLNVPTAVLTQNGADTVATSNVRAAIREAFGTNSPEFKEHSHLELWAGPMFVDMSNAALIEGETRGVIQAIAILDGLIGRLREKRADMVTGETSAPSTYFDRLNLHPRIREVARDRFLDGYPWDAVFAAAKSLVNYVKERSGRHDLDGASLMTTVFSKNSPILAFNDLGDKTDEDEQLGMMHLFEGAVLGIRNPGGHSFPEGPDQRAIEYISFLSLLAYRVQEAKRKKP
ncbi:MAG: TIGR02391 family protein [Candidatus Sulfotelmatobacter sp.]|jgi:uncharacterized protein (TIGR02391 family)